MSEEQTANDAANAVESSGGEQPVQGQAAIGADQAEASAVQPEFIEVGNQKYKDLEEFKKAHMELQKGFTQKTQEYSTRLKAYSGLQGIIDKLRKDPKKAEQFRALVEDGYAPQQAAQAVAQQGQAQTPPTPQRDPELEAKLRELESWREEQTRASAEKEARAEYEAFQKAHADLSEDDKRAIVQFVIDEDQKGRNLSLEEAYKLLWFEKLAPKAISKAQEETEKKIVENRKATTLGSTAPTAQKKAKRFTELSESERLAEVRRILKDNQ